MNTKQISIADYRVRMAAQNVPMVHRAVVCPVCGTVQSLADFMAALPGRPAYDLAPYLGYDCIGRFATGRGCGLTLSGLALMRQVEVLDEAGGAYAIFRPATPEEAQNHMREQIKEAA